MAEFATAAVSPEDAVASLQEDAKAENNKTPTLCSHDYAVQAKASDVGGDISSLANKFRDSIDLSSAKPSPVVEKVVEAVDITGKVLRCSVIARGFEADESEEEKEARISNFISRKALVFWLSLTECALVFTSAVTTRAAITTHSDPKVKVYLLGDMDMSESRDAYITTCVALYSSLRPEQQNVSAARRMISHALGIRIVARNAAAAPLNTKKQAPPTDDG